MKVTTELKNLIKRSFDEKRESVRRENKEIANKLFKEKEKEVISSKEYKNYVKAAQALYERFKDDYENQGNTYDGKTFYNLKFSLIKDIKPSSIIASNIDYYCRYNDEVSKNIKRGIDLLDLAQESLMIKLTYEKDMDTIKTMLSEYGIVI